MKKFFFFLIAGLLFPQGVLAQESKESRDNRMECWREARFGMFIH
jgi:hypothetical protein